MRNRRLFILCLWLAFLCIGALYAIVAPMWDGFDEPGHLAYILFIDEHGRPPGFTEPSFPEYFLKANRFLPSVVGVGAPSFAQWRAMSRTERDNNRAMADQLAADANRYRVYVSSNYERQQGPVFYYIAALPGWLLRSLTLPKLLVSMRLFCVVLASLCVPISAAALLSIGGDAALAIGLPIVALAPNTIFVCDRVSNESLVLPVMAGITCALVEITKSASPRACLLFGILASLGIWTRLTVAFVLPAALVALLVAHVRSPRAWASALAPPALALVLLLAWNQVASGHMSGVIERTTVTQTSAEDVVRALKTLQPLTLSRELIKNHIWAGGWGFVKPPGWVYLALVITATAAVVLALLRRERPLALAVWPLIVILMCYLGAIAAHMVNGAVAKLQNPNFPPVGAEGWYLDELRTIEAGLVGCLMAATAASAATTRRFAQVTAIFLLLITVAGITLLLLPNWAGYLRFQFSPDVYRGAIEAAPVRRAPALRLVIVALLVFAGFGCLRFAPGRTASRPVA